MNVLSLFDGMSCGQQALERAGIEVNQYFASEIDKYAIQVTMANYPNTIQLGSVVGVDGYSLPKIDLLIGGSPCQSFSFAGKRKGMATTDEQEILTLEHYLQLKAEGYEFEGQSYLFWEFMRLLYEVKPKYFLLENVEMGEKWEGVLTQAIGVHALHINSALVSAQNRKRIYFTNIGLEPGGLFGYPVSIIEKPKDKKILLKDILESEIDEKYFLSERMIKCLDSKKGTTYDTFYPADINDKGRTINSRMAKMGSGDNYIVHNTMPRSSTTGKGGTGHLSRNDGKTYCLDTGNTNAVEINVYDGYNNRMRTDEKCGSITQHCSRDGMTNGFKVVLPNTNAVEIVNSRIRRLTPIECERLQTVKDNYTNYVSDSQRYKMLGNGWTIEVISHIFKYIL
jgi:DNA (cytosine-5)-methyltransferase 1